jgi:hypothetical protein
VAKKNTERNWRKLNKSRQLFSVDGVAHARAPSGQYIYPWWDFSVCHLEVYYSEASRADKIDSTNYGRGRVDRSEDVSRPVMDVKTPKRVSCMECLVLLAGEKGST